MTLSSSTSRNDYIGNGAADTYAYSFRILSETDLLVTQRDAVGVETVLSLNTDYSVSGVGSGSGGDVVLLGGNLPSGYALTIRRVRPVTQETDIRNQGASFRQVQEDALDHGIMVAQQLSDEMARTLKLPETEAGTSAATTLPLSADRASKVLGFDSNGNPIAVTSVSSSGITVSAFMATLLDDADAETARGTLKTDNLKGTTGARPTFGNPGRLYINTTLSRLERDSGSAWEEVAYDFPSGTTLVFYQATAPVGWTKSTANNDKALRVVSGGSGGSSGGTESFSAHTHTTGDHTLTSTEVPDHTHTANIDAGVAPGPVFYSTFTAGSIVGGNRLRTNSHAVGGVFGYTSQSAHNHGATGAATLAYIDVIVASKD